MGQDKRTIDEQKSTRLRGLMEHCECALVKMYQVQATATLLAFVR